ncbi:hypothetical protein CLU79DRAFT_777060 [Phycomyces nitens]|nr:hypothetical protein CLU79DRAFT_777060 [Phycomyces nitens]
MGIFTEEVQKTSITHYIERLSNYEEIEWYSFQQLSESILMQETGPREAIEAVRKRLKHGTTQQKLRVLEVLKLLMENSTQKFHRELISNEKMKERFELILSSPAEDITVKKSLVGILGGWAIKYKGDPGMNVISDLYEMGRSRLGLPKRGRSGSMPARPRQSTPPRQESPPPVPALIPADIPAPPAPSPPTVARALPPVVTKEVKRRSLPSVKPIRTTDTTTSRASGSVTPSTPTRVFNFAAAKPRIINEVALANQNSNNLVNALRLINTSEDRWEIDLQHDSRLQDYRQKCEESKKKIVRYARLVEDEEWIGTLLATNEELLKALHMYELMAVGEVPTNMPSPSTMVLHGSQPTSPRSPHTRIPPPPPAAIQPAHTPAQIGYYEPTDTLQSFSALRISPQTTNNSIDTRSSSESIDPFADPVAPVDDIPLNERERRGGYIL